MNYRNEARKCLQRFEEEFRIDDNDHLKYSAIELRMAMEALTYDRALAYKEEFPPSEYQTWQPRRVMNVVLEIEPSADQDCSLAVGLQEVVGVPASNMQLLGAEKVLNMAVLRKHYDALGSYLHIQTMKQVLEGKSIDYSKMRKRLREIAIFITDVLSSPIFNVTCGNFSKMDCSECGNTIRKRIPFDNKPIEAECEKCHATYIVIPKENGKVDWQPNLQDIKCANSECNGSVRLWQRDMEIGKSWTCQSCAGINTFVMGILFEG